MAKIVVFLLIDGYPGMGTGSDSPLREWDWDEAIRTSRAFDALYQVTFVSSSTKLVEIAEALIKGGEK